MKGQESSLADALHSGTFVYAIVTSSKPELFWPAVFKARALTESFVFGIVEGLMPTTKLALSSIMQLNSK